MSQEVIIKWIPVEEEPPDFDAGPLLVTTDDGRILTDIYYTDVRPNICFVVDNSEFGLYALDNVIAYAEYPCKYNKDEGRINVVKEETNMFEAAGNFNGMFGKVMHGMCRLSMNGGIAVKTDNGYKTYNLKTGRLTNCKNFVFDIGEDFFFVIPTNKVRPGDIILVSGKPKCVVEVDKKSIKVINYEDSTLENVVPERHVLLGNTYFYGKIVSMFGNNIRGGKGVNHMMKYMLLSEMMKGNAGSGNMNNMLPLMMMGGGNMFDGMFDFDFDFDEEDEDDGIMLESVDEEDE